MPRVLLLTQPTDGGVFRHIRDLVDGLPSEGWEVHLGAPASAAPAPVPVHSMGYVRAPDPRADARALAETVLLVRRLRPSVVHAHSSKAGALARLARAASPAVPVIYTPHGYAHAGHFERRGERAAYAAAERALTVAATRILCVCEAEAQLARRLGAARRVRVVHNGVSGGDAAGVHPAMEGLNADGPVIATVTLLRPGKGVETLLDALPAVLAQHRGARMVIAGDGPDRPLLERRARDLGVAAAVTFIGFVEGVRSVLAGADLLVHPSWAESFPYAILDAMATGVPVVATDVGGVAEAVVDGETGTIVRPRDPVGLARALSGRLDDPVATKRMARAAQRLVAERFSLEQMVAGVAAVYAEAAGGRP